MFFTAIFFLEGGGGVELAGCVLCVFIGRFKDDSIVNGIAHTGLLLKNKGFLALLGDRGLYVAHFVAKKKSGLESTTFYFGRERLW